MKRFATLITILIVTSVAAQTPPRQEQTIVKAWNECGQSIARENSLIDELTKSLQMNPPWRVVDAREPAKRAKLIDKIIAEHKKRIELLEQIKKEDQ